MLKKVIAIVCCFVLTVAFLCPTEVLAAEYNNYRLEQEVEKILSYTHYDDNGIIRFDEKAAKEAGETDDTIDVGVKLEEISEAYYLYWLAQKQGIEPYLTLEIYGNYCGPGTEPNVGDPIDFVDQQCKYHDDCYGGENMYYACSCDQTLVNSLKREIPDLTGDQGNAAKAIYLYFSTALANPSEHGGWNIVEGVGSLPSCKEGV